MRSFWHDIKGIIEKVFCFFYFYSHFFKHFCFCFAKKGYYGNEGLGLAWDLRWVAAFFSSLKHDVLKLFQVNDIGEAYRRVTF